jgi:C4-dicarboxylate transporter, DctQ subunit
VIRLSDPTDRAIRGVGAAASVLFAAAAAITVYEVVARYVFNAPTTWANELTTTVCAIAFALGGAYCMVRGEHIRIATLLDAMSPSKRRASELVALACGLVYLAGLGYAAVREAIDSVWRFEGDRWAPEPTPGPPNWPLPALTRVMLAVGVALFLVAVLRQLVIETRARRK